MGLTSEELMKRLCKPLRQLIIGYVKWIWIYFEETINTQCLESIWLNLWKITRVFLEVCVAAVWLLLNLSIIVMKITAMNRGTHLAELQAVGKWAETYPTTYRRWLYFASWAFKDYFYLENIRIKIPVIMGGETRIYDFSLMGT